VDYASVEVIKNGSILEIKLNRPKVNAIDVDCSKQLSNIFLNFRDDPALNVAIITGAGEQFFSAGWDLKAEEAIDEDHGPGGFAGLTEMFNLNKPVIAAVNGLAVGGGFELALACDVIVAAEHAELFLPEVMIGIIPDAGGVLRLPKMLPRAIAMEMLYTGNRLSAERAYHFGLINKVVDSKEVMNAARDIATDMAQAAPLAVAAVKEVIRSTEDLSVEEGFKQMRESCPNYKKMLHSKDEQEGVQAFSEKRQPVWKTR